MLDAVSMVSTLFKVYNFDVGIEGERLFRARKGSLQVLIIVGEERHVMEETINEFLRILEGRFADKVLFISLATLSSGAMKRAEENNILVWDRDKLALELGRALLRHMEMGKWDIVNELFKKDTEPVVREVMDAVPVTSEHILKPRMTFEGAISIGGKKLHNIFRYELQLVPYYFFAYSCVVSDGEKETVVKGAVRVNGLTQQPEDSEILSEAVRSLNGLHTKLEPKLSHEIAQGIAMEKVISMNTRTVESTRDVGSITVSEKRTLKPKDNAVKLLPRGIVYVPVWCIEGTNGVMAIDGVSGRILREESYK